MKYILFTLGFFIFHGFSLAQTIPNLEEFSEIARMTGAAATIDQVPNDIISVIENTDLKDDSDEIFCGPELKKNKKEKVTKEITKEKPKLSFYTKITGPVADMKVMDIKNDIWGNVEKLKGVITAQDENTRNQEIAKICDGKTNLEKIQFGSSLFAALGWVYNEGMVGGNPDPFSATDPTKDPSETNLITLQRQYNALNADNFGAEGFPDQGGVCRHASTLVSDFLSHCGFQTELMNQVGYTTGDSGHAVVKVFDPQTGKAYFLNWGELKSMESPDGLTNFDIPSQSIPNTGMIIQLYSPNEKARIAGSTRTNEGVVMARLLGTADENIDFTTYLTTEAGMVVDLGKKTVAFSNGNLKEIEQEISLNYINAQNENYYGLDEDMNGLGFTYKRDATKFFGNHFFWRNKLQSSFGMYQLEKDKILYKNNFQEVSSGIGVAQIAGTHMGGIFKNDKSKTTFEVGGDIVGEFYTINTKTNSNYVREDEKNVNNVDYNYYVIGSVKLTHERNKDLFEANAATRFIIHRDLQSNGQRDKITAGAFNPQATFIYARKLPKDQSVGANMTYIGSFDRQIIDLESTYKNGKINLEINGGFRVIRTTDKQNIVYSVLKMSKEFKTKPMDIKTGVSASMPLKSKTIPYVQGTLVITPNWGK